ncbi:MAG TPA: hypothetical protein VF502_01210 [Stellaceae bacterium]
MLVALAVASAPPARAALACPASRPDVVVTPKLADPVIDNTLPQPALQKLAGKAYHGGRTLGLYRAELRAQWPISFGMRDADGETCRWIDGVVVEILAPERRIFIVRARPPGTCWYDSVLAHERKHQATDAAVVAEYAPRLEREIARAISALPAGALVPVGQAAAAQRRLVAPVQAAIKHVLDALDAARRARQAAIDTPQEYRRVAAACG